MCISVKLNYKYGITAHTTTMTRYDTFLQYACVALFAFFVLLMDHVHNHRRDPVAEKIRTCQTIVLDMCRKTSGDFTNVFNITKT